MIKIEKLEPPQMLFSQNLLEIMEKIQAERETYFPRLNGVGISSPFYRYAPSPESTAVGVQIALNQSQALLTNHIKLHKRKYWAAPLVMKVLYFRPLKRKSSRRWQKKWAKRGWKVTVPQILIPNGKSVMSRKEYEEIMSQCRDATKKAAEAMTKFYRKTDVGRFMSNNKEKEMQEGLRKMKLINSALEKQLLETFYQMQEIAFVNPILKSEDVQESIATKRFSRNLQFTGSFTISIILTLSPEDDNKSLLWHASLAYFSTSSKKQKSRFLWMKKETQLAKEILELLLRDVGLVDEDKGEINPIWFKGYRLTLQAHKRLSEFERDVINAEDGSN